MPSIPIAAVPLITIALIYGFLNGKNDSANVVGPLISTRALGFRGALLVAALSNAAGPFLFGVAVAKTIGSGVVAPEAITLPVIYAALLAAVFWNTITLLLGFPSSASHALVGGLIGAALIGYGTDAVLMSGVITVVLALVLSPLLGLIAGFVVIRVVYFLARGASPRINNDFRHGQLLAAILLGMGHGSNDSQKTMGLITLGLVATGALQHFAVPLWVITVSAAAVAGGTLFGGRRTIRTISYKFFHIRPVHGFAAQSASSLVVLCAGLLGGPVSTSHVLSSAIVGTGCADRVQMVRWQVAERIVFSWVVTIPSAASFAIVMYLGLGTLLH